MRVFSGSLATETNTFGPMPTGLESFKDRGYFAAGQHPDHLTLFSGPTWAARLRGRPAGWTLIEGMVAGAQPSGTTSRYAYEFLRDELLSNLQSALPVDMVLLGLHGAMVADGYDDCEGDLLHRVREIVGPHVVIGAELDPHNHLTQAMVQSADILISFKEYPHTDILERGLELVDLCTAKAQSLIKPTCAVVDCQMIVTMHTSRQPARNFVDKIQSLEGKNGVLSISVTHGFAWGDVPEMGTKILVYTNDDLSLANTLARQLADELIGMRDQLTMNYPDMDEALSTALSIEGPVVISDGADNPGGGASGDSTFFLHRLIDRGIGNVALGPMWDPIAVRIAFEAGEGAVLKLRIGGKISNLSGDPIDLLCTVKALRYDMEMTGLANTPVQLGNCALIESAGIQIVLISLRNQAMGTDLFTNLGCHLEDKEIIVVKSSQHFYASFSKLTKHVIYAASPGSVTFDLQTLDYRKVQRPKWPLDL